MSVSATPPPALESWEPLADSLGELRGAHASLAEFIEGTFAQLERRLESLEEQEQQLIAERLEWNSQLAEAETQRALQANDLVERTSVDDELARDFEELQQSLNQSEVELRRVKEQLTVARESLETARQASAEELERLRQDHARQLALVHEHQVELDDQVTIANSERDAARSAAAALELKQEEWDTLQNELAAQLSKNSTACEPGQSLAAQLEQLQQHCDNLSADLRASQQQMSDLNDAVADRNQRLEDSQNQLSEARNELAASDLELDSLRCHWEAEFKQMVDRPAFEQLQNQLAEAGERHVADRQQLATLRAQLNQATGTADELANVNAQLLAARTEAGQLRHELAESGSSENQLRRQLGESELECRSLEMELEAVRSRVVELSDSLALLKKQNGEERAQWNTELHDLLARQADMLKAHATAPPPAPRNERTTSPGVPPTAADTSLPRADDSVLGSLMVQFENLQKDRLRRRGKQQ